MVLKVVSSGTGSGGGSGTVTSVTGNGTVNGITLTGNVTTSGNLTLGGTLGNVTNAQLVNSSATIGNTVVTLGSTVNNIGNLTLANVTILSGSIPNSAITGLGTMAIQNANLVTITGGTINIPNFFSGYSSTTAANATTVLTVASNHWQKTNASGTNTQIYTLPDGTTLQNGTSYIFDNDAGGNVTINDNSSGLVDTLIPGSVDVIFLESNATVAGAWGKYSWLPAYVNWGTSTADFGNVSVSNVVISGGQINVTTVNMTANTASNATFTSATMQLIPAGYINYDLNGTLVKIPYYSV